MIAVTPVPRAKILSRVADDLFARDPGHPLRVAVDGITAAGKTTFARELTALIAQRGRPAVYLSTDDYHHQRAHRHRQGHDSAVGYYEDAYDFEAFHRLVLTPLGPGGDRLFQARHHDLATDELLHDSPTLAESDAIVIIDGSFLQRREVAAGWDEIIFLDTSQQAARLRGTTRDTELFGGLAAAEQAYDRRYHAAGRLYVTEYSPKESATIVIGNDDLQWPQLVRIGGTAASTVRLFSSGTLLTLSTYELAAADSRESEDYRRVPVTLGSGQSAWVYVPT